MRYRKLPISIEAFLFGVDSFPKWFMEAIINGKVTRVNERSCIIETLEGNMLAIAKEDYIVKGVDGELYPCKAKIFERTYERV